MVCRRNRRMTTLSSSGSPLKQKLGERGGRDHPNNNRWNRSLLNEDGDDHHDDAVSRRRMTTRSLASKQKLSDQRQLVRQQQEVMKKQKKKELKKEKKKKESLSWQTFMRNLKEKKESSSSWQTFIRNLKEKEEEEHKFEDDNSNSCSDFYHGMIRLTYDLPSDDDDDKRQFRLEQQLLQQQGKLNIRESRRFTPNERKEYIEKVDASEGFDVMNIPDDISEYNVIKPYPNFDERSRVFERIKYSAKLALHRYNKQHQQHHHNEEENYYYQFVKVVKVNVRYSAGAEYYITFEAKPVMDSGDAPPNIFQACVYAGITETKVHFCRPEQKSS